MKRKKLRLTPKQAEHMLFNVLEIGSRMLVSGAEVQRVENSIYRMCTAYGYILQLFLRMNLGFWKYCNVLSY